MSESRPPLFFNFRGGLLSSIFSKNHSKCLKMAIYGLKVDIFKENSILRHLEWFLEKMSESRPPLKLKNNGGLLSDIFHQKAPIMRYHICIIQFSDFKKWAVAQQRSNFKIFSLCKIFFYFFVTEQRFICHAPELSSPPGSGLKRHLKMAKNQVFTQ